MERSLHSRSFRTPCTFRHRCRQSPQRSIRFPSRSMWMIMYLSVSSTLVTVCAFNLSCFLRNVSMSTSILFLSVAVHHSPQKIRCIGDSDQPLHRQPAASKPLRLQLHFRDGNLRLSVPWKTSRVCGGSRCQWNPPAPHEQSRTEQLDDHGAGGGHGGRRPERVVD